MNTHANHSSPTLSVPRNDRTALLPKQMLYALSLHVKAAVNGPHLLVMSRAGGLHHLLGDAMISTPEGLRCEVPTGYISSGEGEVGTSAAPSSSALRMRLSVELSPGGPLLVDCAGVVNFDGGPAVFRTSAATGAAPRGSAFIAARFETSSPAHRWLNRRQLFGVGRVAREETSSNDLTLGFTFDLYSAA